MGLLPIFLTLSAFVFLWGLVNYNSFVAQQARINGLREAEAGLKERFEEIVGHISTLPGLTGSVAGYPRAAIPLNTSSPASPDSPAQLAAWRRFAESYPDREAVMPLLTALEETVDAKHRTSLRLSSAVADYNGHCQRMPYRLIARLFNFKPIPQTA
jgi:hypothetical protein